MILVVKMGPEAAILFFARHGRLYPEIGTPAYMGGSKGHHLVALVLLSLSFSSLSFSTWHNKKDATGPAFNLMTKLHYITVLWEWLIERLHEHSGQSLILRILNHGQWVKNLDLGRPIYCLEIGTLFSKLKEVNMKLPYPEIGTP